MFLVVALAGLLALCLALNDLPILNEISAKCSAFEIAVIRGHTLHELEEYLPMDVAFNEKDFCNAASLCHSIECASMIVQAFKLRGSFVHNFISALQECFNEEMAFILPVIFQEIQQDELDERIAQIFDEAFHTLNNSLFIAMLPRYSHVLDDGDLWNYFDAIVEAKYLGEPQEDEEMMLEMVMSFMAENVAFIPFYADDILLNCISTNFNFSLLSAVLTSAPCQVFKMELLVQVLQPHFVLNLEKDLIIHLHKCAFNFNQMMSFLYSPNSYEYEVQKELFPIFNRKNLMFNTLEGIEWMINNRIHLCQKDFILNSMKVNNFSAVSIDRIFFNAFRRSRLQEIQKCLLNLWLDITPFLFRVQSFIKFGCSIQLQLQDWIILMKIDESYLQSLFNEPNGKKEEIIMNLLPFLEDHNPIKWYLQQGLQHLTSIDDECMLFLYQKSISVGLEELFWNSIQSASRLPDQLILSCPSFIYEKVQSLLPIATQIEYTAHVSHEDFIKFSLALNRDNLFLNAGTIRKIFLSYSISQQVEISKLFPKFHSSIYDYVLYNAARNSELTNSRVIRNIMKYHVEMRNGREIEMLLNCFCNFRTSNAAHDIILPLLDEKSFYLFPTEIALATLTKTHPFSPINSNLYRMVNALFLSQYVMGEPNSIVYSFLSIFSRVQDRDAQLNSLAGALYGYIAFHRDIGAIRFAACKHVYEFFLFNKSNASKRMQELLTNLKSFDFIFKLISDVRCYLQHMDDPAFFDFIYEIWTFMSRSDLCDANFKMIFSMNLSNSRWLSEVGRKKDFIEAFSTDPYFSFTMNRLLLRSADPKVIESIIPHFTPTPFVIESLLIRCAIMDYGISLFNNLSSLITSRDFSHLITFLVNGKVGFKYYPMLFKLISPSSATTTSVSAIIGSSVHLYYDQLHLLRETNKNFLSFLAERSLNIHSIPIEESMMTRAFYTNNLDLCATFVRLNHSQCFSVLEPYLALCCIIHGYDSKVTVIESTPFLSSLLAKKHLSSKVKSRILLRCGYSENIPLQKKQDLLWEKIEILSCHKKKKTMLFEINSQDLIKTSLKAMQPVNFFTLSMNTWKTSYLDSRGIPIDEQGVTRDWITKTFDALKIQLFHLPYPKAQYIIPKLTGDANLMELLGSMMALSMLSSLQYPWDFAPFVLKILLSHPMLLDDIQHVSDVLYKALLDPSLHSYDLDFTLSIHGNCLFTIDQRITAENQQEFKRKGIAAVIEEYETVMAPLKRGFNRILPLSFLSLYTVADLNTLLNGSMDVNVEEWKSKTFYEGHFSSLSAEVISFWQIVEEMSQKERRDLLLFTRGTRAIPTEGFASIGRFILQPIGQHQLPSAATWFSLSANHSFFTLRLPVLNSKEQLKQKLTISMYDGINMSEF